VRIGNKEFDVNKTYIMAILNLTPDSFFDGGRFFSNKTINIDKVLYTVEKLIDDGADILDIGGESTRPGFAPISVGEELDRIIPSLIEIKKRFDIPVSVDTYKGDVAIQVIKEKADLINDIGFLSDDMLKAISNKDTCYCLMHNRNLNSFNRDDETISMEELYNEFHNKIILLEEYGFDKSNLIIDPGLGFGKSNRDDIMILRNMSKLRIHDYPVLIGASNKSCIDYVSHLDKDDRLEGTLAITAKAFYNNVSFVRVHNVRSNRLFLDMLQAMK